MQEEMTYSSEGQRGPAASQDKGHLKANPPADPGRHADQQLQANLKLETDLRAETEKWQKKAQELYARISGEDEFLQNISAYIKDCQYFLEKKDLIRAFEAIIWAWAWMEIGLEKGILQQSPS